MEGITFVDAATNTDPVETAPGVGDTSGSDSTNPPVHQTKRKKSGKKQSKDSSVKGGVKKTKGVRRPYRGLERDKLTHRVGVMQQRSDCLTEKLDRANGCLCKLKEEMSYRDTESATSV
eukprot:2913147-Rhodomonas_salina.1